MSEIRNEKVGKLPEPSFRSERHDLACKLFPYGYSQPDADTFIGCVPFPQSMFPLILELDFSETSRMEIDQFNLILRYAEEGYQGQFLFGYAVGIMQQIAPSMKCEEDEETFDNSWDMLTFIRKK